MKIIVGLLFFLFEFGIYVNAACAETADNIVYDTTQEVIERLQSEKQILESNPEHIKQVVKELIVPHMDFQSMAAASLAKDWQMLDVDFQQCLTAGFRNLLVERYAYVLLAYRNQNISYQSAIPEKQKNHISITQTLTRPETKPLTIKYPMRPDADSWKVIDLVIDDVSLVKTYRKMFKRKIQHQGVFGFAQSFEECR